MPAMLKGTAYKLLGQSDCGTAPGNKLITVAWHSLNTPKLSEALMHKLVNQLTWLLDTDIHTLPIGIENILRLNLDTWLSLIG